VQREDTLHADAARHLAHGERLADAATLARDAHALERLQTLLVALAHPHVHPQRIARVESRQVTAQLLLRHFL
jgi:hypothetical protein